MAKEKNAPASMIWRDLFQPGLYKRTQGKYVRQATFAALAVVVLLAAWRFSEIYSEKPSTAYGGATVIAVVGLWLSFRLVNLPKFADFLIAVEADMGKVSWPTRKELFRGSVVVIFTIVSLGFILIGYDLFWQGALSFIDRMLGWFSG